MSNTYADMNMVAAYEQELFDANRHYTSNDHVSRNRHVSKQRQERVELATEWVTWASGRVGIFFH